MTRTDIIVTGYPRSGNTWLCRLLGDVLNSPVGGMYHAKPLCTEGQGRPGRYFIRQLHLRPTHEDHGQAISNAWTLSVPHMDGVRLLHVVRDPRDVVVSVWKYWNIKSLQQALDVVCFGLDPIKNHRAWAWHVRRYIDLAVPLVQYEDLHADTRWHLKHALDVVGAEYRDEWLDPAIERQAFDAKRAQIEKDGASRPYGRTIQLKHLRKGIVGDWRAHFTEAQRQQAWSCFGEVMQMLGYTR